MKKTEINEGENIQLAIARIQGYYQLQAAKINSEAVVRAANIAARARYFQGGTALVGAFGIFGGLAYKIYQDTKTFRTQTKELKEGLDKQQVFFAELAQSYDKLAELYLNQNKVQESEDSKNRSKEIKKGM